MLLRENAKVQPVQFYITSKNLLMAALPIDNRAVTNAILRQKSDQIAGHVAGTEAIWGKKG